MAVTEGTSTIVYAWGSLAADNLDLAVQTIEGLQTTVQFADVRMGQVFYDEIRWLAEVGLTEGYSDGTFRPAHDVSRQATAAFLSRFDQLG